MARGNERGIRSAASAVPLRSSRCFTAVPCKGNDKGNAEGVRSAMRRRNFMTPLPRYRASWDAFNGSTWKSYAATGLGPTSCAATASYMSIGERHLLRTAKRQEEATAGVPFDANTTSWPAGQLAVTEVRYRTNVRYSCARLTEPSGTDRSVAMSARWLSVAAPGSLTGSPAVKSLRPLRRSWSSIRSTTCLVAGVGAMRHTIERPENQAALGN